MVARARLHDHGGCEPVVPEADDPRGVEIVHQDEADAPLWPDVDVVVLRVHQLEPGDPALELGDGPGAEEHLPPRCVADSDLVALACHGAHLSANSPGCAITRCCDGPVVSPSGHG